MKYDFGIGHVIIVSSHNGYVHFIGFVGVNGDRILGIITAGAGE